MAIIERWKQSSGFMKQLRTRIFMKCLRSSDMIAFVCAALSPCSKPLAERRNVEMFLEPLVHIEPLGLKIVGLVATIIQQMATQGILKGERKKAACVLCSLVIFAILLFIIGKTYSS
ncbi:hypothetical protein R6Q59_001891 [Mikania micrantha]